VAQEAKERAEAEAFSRILDQKLRAHERKRQILEYKIEALRAEFAAESAELEAMSKEKKNRRQALAGERVHMARLRRAD
jgi:hypothetical protein